MRGYLRDDAVGAYLNGLLVYCTRTHTRTHVYYFKEANRRDRLKM